MSKPHDAAQRLEVLDLRQSFIVQAPAGSGKTSLLTQRFLRLLTIVNNPEEILAITFTKKAAAEMHQRIMESIRLATKPRPADEFTAQIWDVAVQVLERDADNEWKLLQNPSRLRVQTIDSLCSHLTRQLPVTSGFGASPSIQQNAMDLYSQAARNCLQGLDDDDEAGKAIRLLLAHIDNQLPRVESLLSTMLASRDQWLRHVMGGQSDEDKRYQLENVLRVTIESILLSISEQLSVDQVQIIQQLLRYAASNLGDEAPANCLLEEAWDGEDTSVESLETWQLLGEFLLTKNGGLRKQADAKMGFPAPTGVKDKDEKARLSEKKTQYKELLLELRENEAFKEALSWLSKAPSGCYTDQQWQIIQTLLVILPQAVAHLRMVFQQTASVDFCEVSLSAGHALHDESGVTDVGLRLDYQLQHMLVDEFQDTSETQFMLLKDLVAGWQQGDGRTLFLVGDPMQSIYRFRQAEVGLFLKTKQEGLGEVRVIKPINISVNFRSQQTIVDWVNFAFKQIMPNTDNVYSGAISYKSSIPFQTENANEKAVNYWPFESKEAEGDGLLDLIVRIQQASPNATIGVLVRGRASLTALVKALNKSDISYQATDIDPLGSRQTVIDLMSLTRAYLNPADRVGWLSVLRAPWCALSLNDVYALLDAWPNENVWDLMSCVDEITAITAEGKQSLTHVFERFSEAFKHKERISLSDTIKGLWDELLGPECLATASDMADAERFFECLTVLETEQQTIDIAVLQERIKRLYAAPDVSASNNLQIMTIHKAKGLEFDHVILPGLNRRGGTDDKRLLAWLERPTEEVGQSELMVAPIKEAGASDEDDITQYLNKVEQDKSRHESQRLLYVAATRAKTQLHLSFCLTLNEKTGEAKAPPSNTLLGLLWPVIKNDVMIDFTGDKESEVKPEISCYLNKLNIHDVVKEDLSTLDYPQQKSTDSDPQITVVEFNWASDLAATIGTVCHQWMQILGASSEAGMAINEQAIRHHLLEEGVLPKHVGEAVRRVKELLQNCLQDNRGQWVLNKLHEDSQFELPLSGVINGTVIRCRLDRTFVDEGKRWIIDYKTSRHDDDNKDTFLDAEVTRYKEQLKRYAQLMSAIDSRPIMLGLYYPAFGGWRSWEFTRA